jgi:hypothetical protein
VFTCPSIRPVRNEGGSGDAALADKSARPRACSSSTATCLVSSASRRAMSATCGWIKVYLNSKVQTGQWYYSDVSVLLQCCYSRTAEQVLQWDSRAGVTMVQQWCSRNQWMQAGTCESAAACMGRTCR